MRVRAARRIVGMEISRSAGELACALSASAVPLAALGCGVRAPATGVTGWAAQRTQEVCEGNAPVAWTGAAMTTAVPTASNAHTHAGPTWPRAARRANEGVVDRATAMRGALYALSPVVQQPGSPAVQKAGPASR